MEVEDEDSTDQPQIQLGELYSSKPAIHIETLKIACAQLMDMYIDEEFFNLGREMGRSLRWGELEALGILNEIPDEYQMVDTPGADIFGNVLSKKYNFECECPKCHRTLAASRFAPHLEKCMGMGRNSSRIASRRLAASSNNSNNNNNNSNNSSSDSKNAVHSTTVGSQNQNPLNGELGSEDDHFEEDDDDEDWSLDRKKKTKKGNEKAAVKRKGPLSRVRNTDGVGSKGKRGASPSVTDSPASLSAMENTIHDEDDATHMSLP
ncbi:SAGA-associated factor 11 [Orchesella cincta]|uniref:SAGA-associated factor 11 n=1 Tax=Orchesella cincta TaxID=48709 RepID=A0A1D2MMP5_ORCCI|nr:SAGA-associated factor 11 [Orchesella cincta]